MVKQLVTVTKRQTQVRKWKRWFSQDVQTSLPLLLVVGARGPKVVMMAGPLAKKRDRRCEQSDST